MKKEAALLHGKAVDALVLAVEQFNRPSDRGRACATLILLDHGFEMLLKAAILHRGGRIREPGASNTIGFDACVKQGLSNGQIKFLDVDQAATLRSINALRDAAQHHLLDLSEELLYVHAQAGVTLFGDILKVVFGRDLRSVLPPRVLPISTRPPNDIPIMLHDDIEEITKLLRPRGRKHLQARARARSLALIENALRNVQTQPTDATLDKLLQRVAAGDAPSVIFPEVASLRLSAEGEGIQFSIRITRNEGVPVQLAGDAAGSQSDASVVAVKRVNELGFYTLGLYDVAAQLHLSPPRTTALVRFVGLQEDPDCYREFRFGKSRFGRYSRRAVTRLKSELECVDMDEVWQRFKESTKGPAGTKPTARAASRGH